MDKHFRWKNLFLFSTLISYIYIFMEWLFFITKPSFLDGYTFYENLIVIMVPAGIVSVTLLVPLICILLIGLVFKKTPASKFYFYIAGLLPAFISSILFLILIDNFTYTIFKFGIVSTTGIFRALYAIGFLFLVYQCFIWIRNFTFGPYRQQILYYLSLSLIALSAVIFVEQVISQNKASASNLTSMPGNNPNIVLIGSDGMSADSMSVYGYDRPTTPFLGENLNSFLFAENGFSNWNTSAGSTISMLTGKIPLNTGVYRPEDILADEDAYQHLPGILRKHGYYSVQYGVLEFVDAYSANLQDAFDYSNGRNIDQRPIFQIARELGQINAAYFTVRLTERITDRLAHIFFIRVMENPVSQIDFGGEEVALDDNQKIEQAINIISEKSEPVFLHIHLLGTHGPTFRPNLQVFSNGQEQSESWMNDFYDDAILSFDQYIKRLFDELSSLGELDNTIIIIYSDHGMAYQYQRVPIIFYFPNSELSGRTHNNVQNIDIAPTILDYLDISVPSWMDGYSLLKGEPPKDRILLTGTTPDYLHLLLCENLYWTSENVKFWTIRRIVGHTTPCHQEILSNEDIPVEVVDFYTKTYHITPNDFKIAPLMIDSMYSTRLDMIKMVISFMNRNTFPPAKGIFDDMADNDSETAMLEFAYNQGMLQSCAEAPLSICPSDIATRDEAAMAILRGLLGAEYTPPPATGMFSDVDKNSQYAPWVEDLYQRKITSGCKSNPLNYCPDERLRPDLLQTLLLNAISTTEE